MFFMRIFHQRHENRLHLVIARVLFVRVSWSKVQDIPETFFVTYHHRPLAGYGLPPPRGNFVDYIFLEAQCLARILQHVSPLTMAALSCNSLLHTLPYKIFDN